MVMAFALIAGFWLVMLRRLVNKRTRELVEKNELLRHAYDDMEARVQERTADLAQSNQSMQSEITERKQAEEALRKEKDFAESLIQTAQAVVLVLDTKGHIVSINPYMEEISGYTSKEVQGKDWCSTFLPENIRARVRESFHRAVSDIQTRGMVDLIVTKDGRERQIEWYDKTLKDEKGDTLGLLAIGHDITDRKQAEEALRFSESQSRLMLEQIPATVWTTDRDLRFTSSTGSALTALGLVPNQVVGMSLFEYFHTEDPNYPSIAMHLRVLKGESVVYDDAWLDQFWETRLEPMRDATGEIVGILGISLDITDRKQAAETLWESEARCRAVVEASPDAITLTDIEGTALMSNRQSAILF